jgi:uncharacterized protein YwlG (UPF0340 family)
LPQVDDVRQAEWNYIHARNNQVAMVKVNLVKGVMGSEVNADSIGMHQRRAIVPVRPLGLALVFGGRTK